VLLSGGKTPDAGKSLWGSGFLPSVHQGVNCRTSSDPVLYPGDPAGMDRSMRRMLDTVAEMNAAELARSGDPETLPIKCQAADRAMAGLIRDLEQRGLPDETLMIWGGEFGRTPMMQNKVRTQLKKGFVGRDHDPSAFSMWLAGGGIRSGLAWWQTDEFGCYPVENLVSVRDLQATLLHLPGLDPQRFSYLYQGLENRLIGPTDEGRVLQGILKD